MQVNRYYGESAAEEQLCFAVNELHLCVHDIEVTERVSGGSFVIVRLCSGEKEILEWTEHLLEKINRYADRYERDYRPESICSGILTGIVTRRCLIPDRDISRLLPRRFL